jgi:hypothetical protein
MEDLDHDVIIALLADPDPGTRQYALMQLEAVASTESVPPLVAALGDEDAVVRRLAIGLLEELGDARALPGIIRCVLDGDGEVREAAAASLRDFRGDEAATAMLAAIDHPEAQVRQAVIVGLRELKDRRAVQSLIRALEDASPDVRHEAVITLAYLRLADSVEPLRRRLSDPDANVRRIAVGALNYFSGPALLEDFVRALADSDWRVRAEAAIVPAPTEVAAAVAELLRSPKVGAHVGNSIRRVFIGFSLAATLAVACGLLIGRFRLASNAIMPAFEVLRPIPAVAWIPIAILLFASAEHSMVFITFIVPVLLNTIHGVETLDRRLVSASISLGAGPFAVFREVILPGALPSIVTGLSIGMGRRGSVS